MEALISLFAFLSGLAVFGTLVWLAVLWFKPLPTPKPMSREDTISWLMMEHDLSLDQAVDMVNVMERHGKWGSGV